MKMLLLSQSGLKSPLSHSPWVCGSSGFSQWSVLLSSSHPLVKVMLGRSASPSFPTKQQAGQEMQTTSCDSFEGLGWKPLAEVRCHFGCPGINSGRQEKGGCLFLLSGQSEGDPYVPPTPPDWPNWLCQRVASQTVKSHWSSPNNPSSMQTVRLRARKARAMLPYLSIVF